MAKADRQDAAAASTPEYQTPVAGEALKAPVAIDFNTWVDEYGDGLFRYALVRVRDRATAEDLVQETFLAAIKAAGSFRGDSSPATWLTGILKHKLIDHRRKQAREGNIDPDGEADSFIESCFDHKGRWVRKPRAWSASPSGLLQREEFWAIFEKCMDDLPERPRTAFTLRVIDDAQSDEVCKVLRVSPTNLWVMLHRARARLRACLEVHWFDTKGKEHP